MKAKLKFRIEKSDSVDPLLTDEYCADDLKNVKCVFPKKTLKERLLKFHGFFFGILSAIFLALSNVFIKKTTILSGSEQVAVRYTLQLFIMMIIIKATGNSLIGTKESRKLLMLRGFLAGLTMILTHFTVKLINPTDAVSIFSLKTIIVSIIARIVLKEKVNLAHLICLFLSIIGIFLIAQESLINSNNTLDSKRFTNFTLITNSTKEIKGIFGIFEQKSFKTILGITLGKWLEKFELNFNRLIF